jgi:peptidyl-prolyl cis-trans isomerase B (cyclophilin B)
LRRAAGIVLFCLALALAACGSSKDESSGGGSSNASNAATQSNSQSNEQRSTSQNGAGAEPCTEVSPPPEKDGGDQRKPKGELDASKTWSLVVQTNCGSFTIELDPDASPETSASLVALARAGFFDGLTFHRIVPGFVIQGGDPTGTGGGGPGYKTVDKPPASARYTRGVVAMAKEESEEAGRAGSQFFVVTGEDAGLPPDYAVVGRVVAGLDVIDHIGKLGDPATEQPTQPVVMSKVTVDEG